MLTRKQNFIETVRGGKPDRFVKQYEYMELVVDPIMAHCAGFCDPGKTVKNDWGVTISFREGDPGAFPQCEGDKKVLDDVTEWKNVVKFPDPHGYPESQWEETMKQVNAIDRNDKFVAPFFANGLFEKLHYMMGMEDALCNFYEEPDAMHEFIDALADWEIECAKEMIKRYHPDALFHHDDWGTQISTFLAPDMFNEFFTEPYSRIYKFWKDNGVQFVIHHSDSYAATLVPYMIEMGIDVYQGAVSENNIPELINKYGGKISFQAGLDNGKFDTADWSKEKIGAELEKLFKTAGTKYLIPSFTMGASGSTYPGAYEAADEEIDRLSKVYFK